MIVDYKNKFIFVGLPFSATSAISKELLEHYGCETLLHKHASIPALLVARPDLNINNFEIVAVVRDPVETSLTLYHWLRDNRHGYFTRTENFVENGGSVTSRYRRLYSVIKKRNMSFEQYLDYSFRLFPYDSLLSENARFLTRIIRYENLQDDFKECFFGLGLKIDRDLPSYNETDNKVGFYNIDRLKLIGYYGPFLRYNERFYLNTDICKKIDIDAISTLDMVKFYVLRYLKSYYRLFLDLKLMTRNLSHID